MNPIANAGDTGNEVQSLGLGRSAGREHGSTLQYSCLEKSMDRGAWQATVHGAAKSWTWLTWTQTQLTLYLKESAHMSAGTHIQNTQTQRAQ